MPIYSEALVPPSVIALTHDLVSSACIALIKPKHEPQDDVPLAQCFRFVEMYRYNSFDWREPHQHESNFARSVRKSDEQILQTALENTANELFPGLSREALALRIENGLRNHTIGDTCDIEDARKFFDFLKAKLQKAL